MDMWHRCANFGAVRFIRASDKAGRSSPKQIRYHDRFTSHGMSDVGTGDSLGQKRSIVGWKPACQILNAVEMVASSWTETKVLRVAPILMVMSIIF